MTQKMTRAEHLKAALEVPWQVKHPRVALHAHQFPIPQWELCPVHPGQKIAVSRRGSKIVQSGKYCYRDGIENRMPAYVSGIVKRADIDPAHKRC